MEIRNVIVATKNRVVIDVYDLGHSAPSLDEMIELEKVAMRKGLMLQFIETTAAEKMDCRDVMAELYGLQGAR